MIRIRRGKVKKITSTRPGLTEAICEVEGRDEPVINYDEIVGRISEGDVVVLNTTARNLGLGTGGFHFVIAKEPQEDREPPPRGHIMKLRYTPFQVKCFACEEEGSPHRDALLGFSGLHGLPVVIGELHSQIAPAAAAIKLYAGAGTRVVYIMTDGGALPISMSRLVGSLREKGLIDATITAGHAFGGDLEAVNLHSALAAAAASLKADAIIVAMGPGNVGTGTKYGFSGIEQGEAINAAGALGGTPFVIPRISFADPRPRHQGVSHHALTILSEIALVRAKVCLPELEGSRLEGILGMFREKGISERHDILIEDGSEALRYLGSLGIKVTTMGRTVDEDREFFLTCAAGGVACAKFLRQRGLPGSHNGK